MWVLLLSNEGFVARLKYNVESLEEACVLLQMHFGFFSVCLHISTDFSFAFHSLNH
jgi:hypothetical protein